LDETVPDGEHLTTISWCKYVDGVEIFPKLPFHIRTHKENVKRNEQVKDLQSKA
jgi:hypothetical protein